MQPSFAERLFHRIDSAQYADYKDNYDEVRFGPSQRPDLSEWVKAPLRKACRGLGLYRRCWLMQRDEHALRIWMAMIPDLEWLYGRLADDASRSLLVEVVAYRIADQNT